MIEHQRVVIADADCIIDPGLGACHGGAGPSSRNKGRHGRCASTLTGQHFATYVARLS